VRGNSPTRASWTSWRRGPTCSSTSRPPWGSSSSWRQPVCTIKNNVVGTETVLKAARRHEKKILIASTSEVYGKGRRIPFSEEDDVVLGATSKSRWAYAASKMMDEFYGLAYHQEYGLPAFPSASSTP
jgi:nucleoside-diphosphate-sugar epimerase